MMTTRLQRPPQTTPRLYAQDGSGYDATVHAHYFLGANDWLVTEYDPDDDIAFGWACLNGDRQSAELGYTSIAELESIEIPVRIRDLDTGELVTVRAAGMFRIEREEDWTPMSLRDAIALLDKRQGRA